MPTDSEVRDGRAWAARELQKHSEKNGKRLTREQAERIIRDVHTLKDPKKKD